MNSIRETNVVKRCRIKQGKLLNEYLKIRSIGEGPYSKIKLMRNISEDRLYAMKKYNLFILKKKNKLLRKEKGQAIYTTAAEEVYNEIKVLKSITHPNIAGLVEIIRDQQEQKIYLFLEYCIHGEIANWDSKTQRFTINKKIQSVGQIKGILIQIGKALSYLHGNNVVHRDIKPQNILLDGQMNAKVIDFGRAVRLESSEERLKGSEGTYHFMAPQMLIEMFPQGYDGRQCDMWSLGVTLYAMLFGTLPFYQELLIKLFQRIEKCQYSFPKEYKNQFSIFIPVIQKLLRINPRERLTAQKFINEIEGLKI